MVPGDPVQRRFYKQNNKKRKGKDIKKIIYNKK